MTIQLWRRFSTSSLKPSGIYAPTVTAFYPDESLNEQGTRAYTRFVFQSGVHRLAPIRSAGELVALTEAE
jgi:dihydrodipicolinate synthase/N-acetylneuraminate lyase